MSRRHFLARLMRWSGAASLGPFAGRIDAQGGFAGSGTEQGPQAAAGLAGQLDNTYPPVLPGRPLVFPRDHGAHPAFRTEWWYITAWLNTDDGPLGLQLTIFRVRTPYAGDNPSRFAPRQLLLAHAALADPARGSLVHAEQSWRSDPFMARFDTADTALSMGPPSRRWSLQRRVDDHYRLRVLDPAFEFDIEAVPVGPPVLQGEAGFSRKGPELLQASYYYSRPQMRLEGRVWRGDEQHRVDGVGWLDHEWSSELMHPSAVGWDWMGLNLDNGDALMAFQMRDRAGGVLHSTARFISQADPDNDYRQQDLHPVEFSVLREWESPRTGARYPVSMRLRAGPLDLTVEALFDDQELDSRASTGIIYWEGAVRVWRTGHEESASNRRQEPIGRGYLELTGYATEVLF